MKNKENVYKKSGDRVRTCIYENFKNQAEFARITGFSTANIACICTGQRKLTTDNARKFAKLFGVRMEYLLGEDDFKTEEDLMVYNQKLYSEPFKAMNEHERSISARQLVLYDMVLPWLIQLYDINDNSDKLTQKEYFKFAEYLDHELQHVIQGYFNIKSGDFVNPINTKSDTELFERYTRDCLEELRKKTRACLEDNNNINNSCKRMFESQDIFSYSIPNDSMALYDVSEKDRLLYFESILNWFSNVRKFYYDSKAQSAIIFLKEHAIQQALKYVKSEYTVQAREILEQGLINQSIEETCDFWKNTLFKIPELFDKFYQLGYLINSNDIESLKQDFTKPFFNLFYIQLEARKQWHQ